MTVYKGILNYVSGSAPRLARQAITRQYIEIDNRRIKKVVISDYLDELMIRYLGREVALSGVKIWGYFHVIAIRTPDGEVSKDDHKLRVASFLILGLGWLIANGIISFGWYVYNPHNPNLNPDVILGLIVVLVGYFILIYSIVLFVNIWRATIRAL